MRVSSTGASRLKLFPNGTMRVSQSNRAKRVECAQLAAAANLARLLYAPDRRKSGGTRKRQQAARTPLASRHAALRHSDDGIVFGWIMAHCWPHATDPTPKILSPGI